VFRNIYLTQPPRALVLGNPRNGSVDVGAPFGHLFALSRVRARPDEDESDFFLELNHWRVTKLFYYAGVFLVLPCILLAFAIQFPAFGMFLLLFLILYGCLKCCCQMCGKKASSFEVHSNENGDGEDEAMVALVATPSSATTESMV